MFTIPRAIICVLVALVCLLIIAPGLSASADSKVIAIDAYSDCRVALLDNGTVWTWGTFYVEHVPDGVQKYDAPVMVPIDHVKAVSAGFNYALALKDDGTVWGWGDNSWGQLGDGTFNYRRTPVQVKGLADVEAIAAGGGQSMALKKDGTVWTWGRGFRGQLGTGIYNPKHPDGSEKDDLNVPEPVQINLSGVKAIDSGAFFSVAVKDDGTVWTWGENSEGALGDGTRTDSPVPVQALISDITAVSCGHSYILALKDDGTVWGWGDNSNNQLGNRSNSLQTSPVKVNELSDAVAIAAGDMSSYAVRKDGTVWAWGASNSGSLGDGYSFHRSAFDPVNVIGLNGAKAVAAGSYHAMALLDDGSVWAWGQSITGYDGQPIPAQVPLGLQSRVTISATPHSPFDFSTSPSRSGMSIPNIGSSSAGVTQWTTSAGEPVQYLAPASGDQLYTFYKNNISLYQGGALIWSIEIPDRWLVTTSRDRAIYNDPSSSSYQRTNPKPIVDMDNGYLYVYAIPANPYKHNVYNDQNWQDPNADGREWDVLAISPDGTIAWTLPLNTTAFYTDETVVRASGDRVYIFHCYDETVVDLNGTVLFTIPNIASPAAIDEAGNLYVVPASSRDWYVDKVTTNGAYLASADFRLPGSTIQSYYPNGTLRWSRDVGETVTRPYIVDEIRPWYGTLPVYENGTLFVPEKRGVITYDTSGKELWSQRLTGDYYDLFELMPVDSKGNVYLRAENFPGDSSDSEIYVISADGRSVSEPRKYYAAYDGATHASAREGILYDLKLITAVEQGENRTMEDLDTFVVSAYDLIANRTLWSYRMPVDNPRTLVVDTSILYSTFVPFGDEDLQYYVTGPVLGYTVGALGVGSSAFIDTYPVDGRVFINFRSVTCPMPIALNQTECKYAGGIYYIDTNGTVLYGSQTDRPIGAMAVNNSTVYYSGSDGQISSVVIGIASGLTLIAVGAIALKFLFAGTIARARSRLDKNENRAYILKYIGEHPGLTSYELARGLNMNHGTLRYHLFVLGNNHRIAAFKDDNRYVRYFPNAGRYSREDQMIISLLRRESLGKIMSLIAQRPGITNAEIARELDLPDSLISRYLKELLEKGIVEKPGSGSAYQLTDMCQTTISRVAELL